MKNISIVNRTVAQKLGIDIKTVEKVNKSFWKEVHKQLVTISENPVHVKLIGTISASPYKVNIFIRNMIGKIRKIQKSTKYRPETRERYLNQYYGDLRKVLVKRNQIALEYYNKTNGNSK